VLDIHQHLWPQELLSTLAGRRSLPRLRRGADGWVIQLAGEPDAPVDFADHDPERRALLARAEGFDGVVIAPSAPIGIEALPPGEAAPLLRAYHDGVRVLPSPFRGWATASLQAPDADELAGRLDEGFVGLCVPAAALADRRGLQRLSGLLETLVRHDAPLFVHPGPAPWHPAGIVDRQLPAWWSPLTAYVTQMHVAWHLWLALGRRVHPDLRVCFALLAGLAPLHAERRVARGGPEDTPNETLFYDTSSYGPPAIGQVAEVVGPGALVHGSDRPVVDPPNAVVDHDAIATTRGNPARLLGSTEAS
jgi:predicted TIM-barrel fold metal-dependent hydrolase